MGHSAKSKESRAAKMARGRSQSSRTIGGGKGKVSVKVKQIEFVSKHQKTVKGRKWKKNGREHYHKVKEKMSVST